MDDNKGFTLVELLGVIAILAILAAVATPIVLTVQKNIKEKVWLAEIKMIREAAIMCAEKNGGSDNCDTISELCLYGFLDVDKNVDQTCNNSSCACQQNPVTGDVIGGCGMTFDKKYERWIVQFTGKVGETSSDACPQLSQ